LTDVEPDQDFADRLEIFFGEASDTQCHVYARLRGPEAGQGLQLSGSLTGPTCTYAQTLPARFAFKDRGPGASVLAEAIVPEPCFWTPEMPHLYQAEVQLLQDGRALARAERPLGIRRLGVHNRHLIYDGKRWVLRGMQSGASPPIDLNSWHESDLAMIVHDPDDALCREASHMGVFVVAALEAGQLGEIARLSRWPAVGIVTLPNMPTLDSGGLAHNLLLAQRIAAEPPSAPQPWAQLAVCEMGRSDDRIEPLSIPIIAFRATGGRSSVVQGRAKCDLLQRDLAGRGEFAGYIV
jgi:hypothetical protein